MLLQLLLFRLLLNIPFGLPCCQWLLLPVQGMPICSVCSRRWLFTPRLPLQAPSRLPR